MVDRRDRINMAPRPQEERETSAGSTQESKKDVPTVPFNFRCKTGAEWQTSEWERGDPDRHIH
jgi:hypothetical protein